MCRASRALAASIAAFGLSACQLPIAPERTVEQAETAPVAVVVPSTSNTETTTVPVSMTIDEGGDNVDVKTITLIEVEERPSLVLQELAKFTRSPKSQSRFIKGYRENYLAQPNQINALKLGLALAVSGTDDNALNEALGLLKRVDASHPDHALAVLVTDQTRKQLSLLNTQAKSPTTTAPTDEPTPVAASAPTSDVALNAREQALHQREIELLERERSIAGQRGENFRLRQQLAQAEQKLRELAQIEDDLARTTSSPQP